MSGCVGCGADVNTQANPMVVGQPDGSPARRVEFVIATFGRKAGDHAWITGDQAEQLIAFGFVLEVPA